MGLLRVAQGSQADEKTRSLEQEDHPLAGESMCPSAVTLASTGFWADPRVRVTGKSRRDDMYFQPSALTLGPHNGASSP